MSEMKNLQNDILEGQDITSLFGVFNNLYLTNRFACFGISKKDLVAFLDSSPGVDFVKFTACVGGEKPQVTLIIQECEAMDGCHYHDKGQEMEGTYLFINNEDVRRLALKEPICPPICQYKLIQ